MSANEVTENRVDGTAKVPGSSMIISEANAAGSLSRNEGRSPRPDEGISYENYTLPITSNEYIKFESDGRAVIRELAVEDEIQAPEEQAHSVHSNRLLSQQSSSKVSEKEEESNHQISTIQLHTFINSTSQRINNFRLKHQCQPLFQDIGLTIMANEYSLLEEDLNLNINRFNQIIKKNNFIGKVFKSFVSYDFFDDEAINMESIEFAIGQSLSIFMEIKEELDILLEQDINSIGIGISIVKQRVSICLCFSQVSIKLSKVNINAIGKLEFEGNVLLENFGVYLMRISSLEDEESFIITPQNITFDIERGTFMACVEFSCNLDAIEKIVEVFVKNDPSNIKYGMPSNIKYIPKNYEACYSFPLIKYPFTKLGDRKFSKMLNLIPNISHNLKNFAAKITHEKETDAKNGDSPEKDNEQDSKEISSMSEQEENSGNDRDTSQQEDMHSPKFNRAPNSKFKMNIPHSIAEYDLGKQFDNSETPRQGEDGLKRELEDALNEARKELQKQISKNKNLQTKVWYKLKTNKTRDAKSAFINNEYNTNEIKYANSIALNTEIRNELKQIKEKYNQASRHIVGKFDEKRSRFVEIKDSFLNLKQEVCKNAIYETTMKKIPPRILDEVEAKEVEVNDFCNDLRLEMISMRMDLEKNLKLLANKEELADGLHLIDFEKLKIENQSLSEKIEERNDEIFKLTSKNNVNVHILAHVKEKLKWEQNKIQDLVGEFNQIGSLIRRRLQGL
jgi:hypothetical protein